MDEVGGRIDSRLRDLFDVVVELPVEARTDFLETECSDEETRHLVRMLLLHHERPGETIDNLLASVRTAWMPGRLEGERVGAYRLGQLVGGGGMGEVYLATRVDGAFRQEVAIKLLRSSLSDEVSLERFEKEREILAALHHPRIAQLLDGGTSAFGPYLVMEPVEGRPITKYCDERRASIRQRLELFLDLCEAVDYAHRQLVVHRDIKPGNVLVTEDGHPKLLDFGIAKVVSAVELAEGTATLHRALTPEYASPEQLRGGRVATASDVYSLGVLLHQLLTGLRPVERQGRSALELAELIESRQYPTPVAWATALAERSSGACSLASAARARSTEPGALRRELAEDLGSIVLSATRAEAQERYGSAQALGEDVRRYLEGMPIRARTPTRLYRLRKWWGRNRWIAASGLAFVLVLLTATVLSLLQARRIAAERARAEHEEEVAEQVTRFLVESFSRAHPDNGSSADVTPRDIITAAAEHLDGELIDPELRDRLRLTIGRVFIGMGLHDDAIGMLAPAVEGFRAAGDSGGEGLVATLNELMRAQMGAGQLDPMLATAEAALAAARRVYGSQHAMVGDALHNVGLAYLMREDLESAERYHREALVLRERLLGREHELYAATQTNLATILHRQARYEEAVAMLQDALRTTIARLGEDHQWVASTRYALANALDAAGRHGEAAAMLRQILAHDVRTLGAEHPEVARTMQTLGRVLVARGEFEEAETLLRQSLSMRTNLLGADHPDLAHAERSLAELLLDRGEIEEAATLLARSEERYLRIVGENHVWRAANARALGRLAARAGRLGEAGSQLRRAIEIERGLKSSVPVVSNLELAEVLVTAGRYEEAEAAALPALDWARDHFAADDSRVVALEGVLGAAYLGKGELDAARPLLDRARRAAEDRPAARRSRRHEVALQRWIELLEATGRGPEAAEFAAGRGELSRRPQQGGRAGGAVAGNRR